MGSGSSRHATQRQHRAGRKTDQERKRESVLTPFFRSMNCRASSSRRAQRSGFQSPMHIADCDTEILACRNLPGKDPGISCEVDSLFETASNDEKKHCRKPCNVGSTSAIPLKSLEFSKVVGRNRLIGTKNSSSSSMVGFHPKAGRSRELVQDERHLVLRERKPASSFCEITGGSRVQAVDADELRGHELDADELLGHESYSEQFNVPCLLGGSAGLSEPVRCQDLDVFAVETSLRHSRTQAFDIGNDSVDGGCVPLECHDDSGRDGLFRLVEQVPGKSSGSRSLRNAPMLVSDNSFRTSPDANASETGGILQGEASGLSDQYFGETFDLPRGEGSVREVRRNNRRWLRDAFMRNTSRQSTISPMTIEVSEDRVGSESLYNSWAPSNWDSSDWIAGEGGPVFGRCLDLDDQRWRVRSQRLSSGSEAGSRHLMPCASGMHRGGRCSCETNVMAEEMTTEASISRIIMLAEALFEVLDEIYQQSVTLSRSTSLSLMSLPAPDAIVDSLRLRVHKKVFKAEATLKVENTYEAAQCYICLVEYEDGDRVRVLPCSHEYHMACVDKWLKEVHRVCPLCRHNVCERSSGNSVLSIN